VNVQKDGKVHIVNSSLEKYLNTQKKQIAAADESTKKRKPRPALAFVSLLCFFGLVFGAVLGVRHLKYIMSIPRGSAAPEISGALEADGTTMPQSSESIRLEMRTMDSDAKNELI